jgi:hypothetical protein
MMQPLLPASPDDLVAAQLRLARAKDADDTAQADMRTARADATAAKKELKAALRGWRDLLRQIDGMSDAEIDAQLDATLNAAERANGFDGPCHDGDTPPDVGFATNLDEDPDDPDEEQPAEPVPAGRRR